MTGLLATAGGDAAGSAGYIALLIIVLMFIATVLLVRNMGRRLERMPKEFPPPDDRREDGPTA